MTSAAGRRPTETRRRGTSGTPPPLRESLAEAGLAFAGLLVLGGIVFGARILHGGFIADDWGNYAMYSGRDGLMDAIGLWFDTFSYRPVMSIYQPVSVAVFGHHDHLFVAWATATACMMSAAFFLLLRTLGLGRWDAAAIAALLLIFPASDSTKLWATAAHQSLAVTTCFLGVTAALRGLEYSGRRAIAIHAGALTLFLLSILNHELTAPLILGAVLLYRLRVPWRRALRLFAIDATAVVLTLKFVTSASTNPFEPQGLAGMAAHALDIGVQALILIAASMMPWVSPKVAVVLVPSLLGLVALIGWRRSLPDSTRTALHRWILIGAAGLLAAALAYSIFIPAPDNNAFQPLVAGLFRRTNLLAGAGIVVFLYATLQATALIIFKANRAAVVVLAMSAFIGIGYFQRIGDDVAAWNRGSDIAESVLTEVQRLRPHPGPHETLFVGGYSPSSAPGVPSFFGHGDLTSGLVVRLDNRDLKAFPIVATYKPGETCLLEGIGRSARARCTGGASTFSCQRKTLVASNPTGDPFLRTNTRFGTFSFLNLATGEVRRPRTQRECQAAVRATPGGRFYDSLTPIWPAPSLRWTF